MNKKIFSTIILCVAFIPLVHSQTSAGNFLVGGSANTGLNFNNSNTRFNFAIHPNIGYFVKDDIALGTSFVFGLSLGDNYSQIRVGLVPFGRYYFGNNEISKTFVKGKLGFENVMSDYGDLDDNDFTGIFGVGIGKAFFLSPSAAIEASLEYDHWFLGYSNSTAFLGLRFGFQIYLEEL